ncbi:MAG: radical SAM protein [Candidatus Omnitrophica bacterium]|nr:radical SAM protein [Candidatus Omnitrophota bacterium]
MMRIETRLVIKRFMLAVFFALRYGGLRKLINLIYNEYERRRMVPSLKSRPYFIKLQVSNYCEAGCKYCIRNYAQAPFQMLSYEKAMAIIDQVCENTYLMAFHYSGESLMNKDIFKIVQYAHNCNIATYLSTNLLHLSDFKISEIFESGLDLLTISIDGISQETYGVYREQKNIKLILNNMQKIIAEKKRMRRRFPLVNLQYLVMNHNVYEIELVKKLGREYGVDMIDFKPIGTKDKAFLPKNKEYVRASIVGLVKKRMPCWWLWGAAVVLNSGSIVPCCMATVREDDYLADSKELLYIQYNNEQMRKLREKHSQNNLHNIKYCVDCPIPYGAMLNQTI